MERVAGLVDDRLEELVPRPRGRRQARDVDGGTGAGRAAPVRRGVDLGRAMAISDTSLWRDPDRKGCEGRAGAGLRNRSPGRSAPVTGPGSPPIPAARAERGCPRRARDDRDRAARDPLAAEVRLLGSLLGQVIAGAGRPRPARSRRAGPSDDDPPPPRRRSGAARPGSSRSSRARAGPGRGRGPRLQPLFPARQPRRGARARPDRPPASGSARAGRASPAPADADASLALGRRLAAAAPARSRPRSPRPSRGLRITPVLTAHPTEARAGPC